VSGAARRLGFSQAALSTQLAATESALDVTLFERHGRGMIPTEAGRSAVQRVRDVFAAVDALRADATGAQQPIVTIGATEPTAGRLVPFVRRIERAHADLRFEMRVATPSEIRRLIEAGDLELALTVSQQGNSRVATFEPLYEQELVLLVHENHALAQRSSATLAQLAGEQLLVGEDTCHYRRVIEGFIEEADVDVALRARFGAISTLGKAVAAGFGVAILPRDVIEPLPPHTVCLPMRKKLTVTVGLLLRRDASENVRRAAAAFRAEFHWTQMALRHSITRKYGARRYRATFFPSPPLGAGSEKYVNCKPSASRADR
jgi:LysR family nitrogen assimilation transcriptional regulator